MLLLINASLHQPHACSHRSTVAYQRYHSHQPHARYPPPTPRRFLFVNVVDACLCTRSSICINALLHRLYYSQNAPFSFASMTYSLPSTLVRGYAHSHQTHNQSDRRARPHHRRSSFVSSEHAPLHARSIVYIGMPIIIDHTLRCIDHTCSFASTTCPFASTTCSFASTNHMLICINHMLHCINHMLVRIEAQSDGRAGSHRSTVAYQRYHSHQLHASTTCSLTPPLPPPSPTLLIR